MLNSKKTDIALISRRIALLLLAIPAVGCGDAFSPALQGDWQLTQEVSGQCGEGVSSGHKLRQLL